MADTASPAATITIRDTTSAVVLVDIVGRLDADMIISSGPGEGPGHDQARDEDGTSALSASGRAQFSGWPNQRVAACANSSRSGASSAAHATTPSGRTSRARNPRS